MRKVTTEDGLRELSVDAGIMEIRPKVAYTAETEDDVASAVKEALNAGLAVTPRGAGTSIPSQSIGKGAILLQARSSVKIRDDGTVACQPGVVKAELNRVLGPDRWMPVDPSSYASCTVGGMVANNASGIRTPKYGSTIDYVRGLRVVAPGKGASEILPVSVEEASAGDPETRRVASLLLENRAEIDRERPRVTKNSSGYRIDRVVHDEVFDLPKLFVGSEGTLGVSTEITLSTRARPTWRTLLIVEASLKELDSVVGAFREHRPTALELVDKTVFRKTNRWDRISRYSRSDGQYMVFCELDGGAGEDEGLASAVASSRAGTYDPMVVQGPSEVQTAWEARNETLSLAQDMRIGSRKLVPGVEDLVVPPAKLGDLVRLLTDQFSKRGLDSVCYGHAGDANLHFRPFLDLSERGEAGVLEGLMDECFEAVWKMGGSITGEHGDGRLRARYVERQYPRTYWIMKEVKRIYDPKGVLNPGVKIA